MRVSTFPFSVTALLSGLALKGGQRRRQLLLRVGDSPVNCPDRDGFAAAISGWSHSSMKRRVMIARSRESRGHPVHEPNAGVAV
jgi:hypothetical protein